MEFYDIPIELPFDNCDEHEFYISRKENVDLFNNLGIIHEINRSFLHPIGLAMSVGDNGDISIYNSKKPEGFLYDRIDRNKVKSFNDFRNKRIQERQEHIGFSIQTKDLINSEYASKKPKKTSPKEELYTIFLKIISNMNSAHISAFADMLNSISMNDPDTAYMWSSDYLEYLLQVFVNERNWNMVGFVSLLLDNYTKLRHAFNNIQKTIQEGKDGYEEHGAF